MEKTLSERAKELKIPQKTADLDISSLSLMDKIYPKKIVQKPVQNDTPIEIDPYKMVLVEKPDLRKQLRSNIQKIKRINRDKNPLYGKSISPNAKWAFMISLIFMFAITLIVLFKEVDKKHPAAVDGSTLILIPKAKK